MDIPKTLYNRGFVSLLCTQFLGAANDNVLKQILAFMVITGGLWANQLGKGGQGFVALGLTLPFILLSGYAGQLSDRVSKTRVAVWMKILEIPIALTAGIGLMFDNLWITLCAFVALATQSTFFGPAKYGVIPELVVERHLSRANGAINMLTNIAIIIGTLLAGPISDAYFPPTDTDGNLVRERMLWLPLVVMLCIAVFGLVASLFLPKLEAQDSKLKFDANPFGTYIESLREMSKTPLIGIAFGWAYFYLIGMLAILILPEYKDLLSITYTQASVLFVLLAISIGVGSIAAGYISGDRIEPRLVRFGAVGLTVFFFLLGLIAPPANPDHMRTYYWIVAGMLIGAGFFAGFYLVPLQAMIQDLAPLESRGRFLGTTNALSFVFSSLAGVLVIVLRHPRTFNMPANRIFLVCAGLSIVGILFAMLRTKAMRRALYEHMERRDARMSASSDSQVH